MDLLNQFLKGVLIVVDPENTLAQFTRGIFLVYGTVFKKVIQQTRTFKAVLVLVRSSLSLLIRLCSGKTTC